MIIPFCGESSKWQNVRRIGWEAGKRKMVSKRLLDIDDIKRGTDLAEIISAHVALKGSGHKFKGLCPFHQEKTPSFTVDTDKGLFHCFSCKTGGDVFKFVELMMGLSFPEAAQWLARRLDGEFKTGGGRQQTSETQRLASMHQEAASFYRRTLAGDDGKEARKYLEKRLISPEAAIRFGLGYAPKDWDRLFDYLRDRGFSEAEIIRSGLCLPRKNSGGAYDRFRHRLIFPILDVQERVIAFGGRALSPEDEPKYLNSPETALFQKGRMLYGLSWAARAAAARKRILVVEGYFDLIRCHLAGIEETVATLGTALTAVHLELLRRRGIERVYLVFDSDSAGLTAALRSREIAANAGVGVLAARLPAGHDPDTLVLEGGAPALEAVLAKGQPLVELTLEAIIDRFAGQSESQRLGILKEGAEILSGLRERVEREHYIPWLAERFCAEKREDLAKIQQMLLGYVQERQTDTKSRRDRLGPSAEAMEGLTKQVSTSAKGSDTERRVLAALLAHPGMLVANPELIVVEDFEDTGHRALVAVMLELAQGAEEPDCDRVGRLVEDAKLHNLLTDLSMNAPAWADENEVQKLITRMQTLRIERKRRELCARVAKEEKDGKENKNLQKEIDSLSREKMRQVDRWVVGE
jgi:DNA primase